MNATPFTHTPRPPRLGETYAYQRYFGDRVESSAPDLISYARVYRKNGDTCAEVSLRTISERSGAELRIDLPPAALRELARCLIDGAADIEAEQAEGVAA